MKSTTYASDAVLIYQMTYINQHKDINYIQAKTFVKMNDGVSLKTKSLRPPSLLQSNSLLNDTL